MTEEERRLNAARTGAQTWRRLGPYISERQWGTVREDYSTEGTPWEYLPHDHARSRAYRWGEDGIAGISDDDQHLCFALALWNGTDPILKERMFGLTGNEGNHGEDVKECYFYLDNVPSHAYMKHLYKYPQRPFPYAELIDENRQRGRDEPEYELLDTGIFDDDRYFDVLVEYAKAAPENILIRITAVNRGAEPAELHLLPTLWFRNDWSWHADRGKPCIEIDSADASDTVFKTSHPKMTPYRLVCPAPENILFTENETNNQRLFGIANTSPYVKDAFNEFVVLGRREAVNPARLGTKAAAHYVRDIGGGETVTLVLQLCADHAETARGDGIDALFALRKQEADEFYRRVTPFPLPDDMRNVQRQAFAGLLWNKQYYHFLVHRWLEGDPGQTPPPEERKRGRNRDWWHLATGDVLSVPDKWEYPWFAAWDMAFHAVALAMIDPDFAKDQLLLLTREWYMHPNGQIPAYEWRFSDVNPPVHAWAAIRVYQIEQKIYGRTDRAFLERVFQKLMINFTWWVNRKDAEGNNIFEGGFLGLDNICAFDRSEGLPGGGQLEQADGTSWMAMYCLNLLTIALELAKEDPVYEDVASKFFEHFVYIGASMNHLGHEGGLWNEDDSYYFDVLKLPDGSCFPLRAITIGGTVPLAAIAIGDLEILGLFRGFSERMRWFADYRPELLAALADPAHVGIANRFRLALVNSRMLAAILGHVLGEDGMLGTYGVRSVSKQHATDPFVLELDGQRFVLDYEPAESTTALFGGNSNWRGPIWFPLNFLLIEALQKHHYFLGDDFKVDLPSGSGNKATLWEVTTNLTLRLIHLFLRDENGRRPIHGDCDRLQNDPNWRDLILFHEYFNGDTGAGLGASHQTGWTALVAKLIQQYGEYALQGKPPCLAEEEASGFGSARVQDT